MTHPVKKHASLKQAKQQVYRDLKDTSPRDEIDDAQEELWRAGLMAYCSAHGEDCVIVGFTPKEMN